MAKLAADAAAGAGLQLRKRGQRARLPSPCLCSRAPRCHARGLANCAKAGPAACSGGRPCTHLR
eukprot:663689-Alexandrium_andersonii.AAC.1